MKYVARPYQREMTQFILRNPRCALWCGMGLGKSVSTLTAIDVLQLTIGGPALVIAPKRVAVSVWPAEVQKWDHLKHLVVSVVTGTPAQRKAALAVEADIYTINYDNLPWLIEHLGNAWPFKIVVADESTKLKSFRTRQGGSRARALGKVAHARVTHFIELTGTPSPNGLADLWGQAWFLDKGARLGASFTAFENRWFQKIQVGSDRFAVELRPRPFARKEIEEKLRDVCLSLDAKDHFDIADPIVNNIFVELPSNARKLYRDMEQEMFLALANGTEVEAFNAAARTMKCLQLGNGAVIHDSKTGAWTEVHDVKLQALEEIVEEAAGAPVLVAYHFKSDLARLLKRFPKGRELDDDPRTVVAWNAGKIPVLLAHPASAGHGLNLQDGGNILVYFSHNWNLEERMQILERIGPTRQAQSGHNRPVFVHNIIATGTVDEMVLERIATKASVQSLLLAAMKRSKE